MELSAPRRVALATATTMLVLLAPMNSGVVAQTTSQHPHEIFNSPTESTTGVMQLQLEDATLTRSEDAIVVEVTMDVPTPGTYVYPEGVPPERQAAPEAFTLWTFVFNYPENCISDEPPLSCGGDDFSESVKAGVYGLGGHVPSIDHSGGAFEFDRATDGRMTLTGEIKVGDPQRTDSPPGSINFPLENPMGAEVHFAVAPHGQIDPGTMVAELYEPVGEPDCGCWWGGLFSSEME